MPDEVRVVLRVDAVVRGREEAIGRVDVPRQVLERDPAVPLVLGGPAGHRRGAVAEASDRVPAGALVADGALDIGVDDVLARRSPVAERLPERGEVLRRRHAHEGRGRDRARPPRPPQRVRLPDAALDDLRLGDAHDVGIQDRAVAGLADLEDDGLVATPHLDRLEMHGEGLPGVLDARGGPVPGQALQVEVLCVPTDVREAPRVVRGVTDHDAGREGQAHARGLVPGRREMALEPDRGREHGEMGIVREERSTGRAARAGDHPVVRALSRGPRRSLLEQVEGGRTDPMSGDREGDVLGEVGEQVVYGLGAEALGDLGPQEFLVPVPVQVPRHPRTAGRPRGVVLGQRGREPEHRVLDGRGGHRVQPREGALAVGGEHPVGLLVPSGRDLGACPVPAHRAGEPIGGEPQVADHPGQPSVREAEQEVDLEQPLGRDEEPLHPEEVIERVRVHMRDPPRVVQDLDARPEARQGELALQAWRSGRRRRSDLIEPVGHRPEPIVAGTQVPATQAGRGRLPRVE